MKREDVLPLRSLRAVLLFAAPELGAFPIHPRLSL
jgi:hypothetical protein